MAKKLRHVKIVEKLHKRQPPTQSEIKELAKYEEGELPTGVVESQEQVAKIFGVSHRTVERWFQDGAPVLRNGRYSIVDIRDWKIARTTKSGKKKKEGADGEDWEERYRRAKALREERKESLESGEVVLKSEVEAGLIQASVAVKRSLLTLPRVLAPILQGMEPREIEKTVRIKVEDIINMFSKEQIFSKKKESHAGNDRKAKHLDRKRK